MTIGSILCIAAVLVILVTLAIGMGIIPTICPVCRAWGKIHGSAHSFAGETIFRDAECARCKTPMYVDSAGYIRHAGFLWLFTIPLQDKEIEFAAKEEVDKIAPNAE